MTTSQPGGLTLCLYHVLRAWRQDGRSDAELLSTFAQTGDDRAFATLVSRHGPLVWGVCWRILRHREDAEDAFQATFLILAKRAGQVSRKELVSHWLYGVAQHSAWKLRDSLARRQHHERLKSAMMPVTFSEHEGIDATLLSALEEEMQQLPESYRLPLSLCYFEGRSYAEAARLLGCPKSTVHDRVARAEQLLRERLTRRGVALSGASLAAILGQATVATALPPRLLSETVRAALAFVSNSLGPTKAVLLAQGVLRAMRNTKAMSFWSVTVTALLCLGGVSLELVAQPGPAGQTHGALSAPEELQAPAAAAGQRLDQHGDPLPKGALARIGTLRFRPDKWEGEQSGGAFLPAGKTLVSAHGTDTVHFWDVATGKEQRRLQIPGINKVWRIRVSPDGKLLAVSGQREFNLRGIEVWDLTSDPPRQCWAHQSQGINILTFSPDGKTLACNDVLKADENETLWKIDLLDAHTGKPRQKPLECDDGWGKEGTTFSPDGKFLAANLHFKDGDSMICLWDLATGKKQHTITQTGIRLVGFAPDGRTIATWLEGTTDAVGVITLWDVATRKEKRRIRVADFCLGMEVAFLPDGVLLCALLRADGAGWRHSFWDPDTGKQRRPEVEVPTRFNNLLLLSPDGKLLANVHPNTIQVCDVGTGKFVGPEGIPYGVQQVAFSAGGDAVATFSGGTKFPNDNENWKVQLWQAQTGALGLRLKFDPPQQKPSASSYSGLNYTRDHRLYTYRMRFTRGGPPNFEVKVDSDLVCWDTRAGKTVELPQALRQAIGKGLWPNNWLISPQGQLLAQAIEDNIVLHEMATGKEVRRLKELSGIQRMAFSADEQSLVACTGGEDNNFTVWDVVSGRQRHKPLSISLGILAPDMPGFIISPDSRWLAAYAAESEDNQPRMRPAKVVRLWEAASGKPGPRLLTGAAQIHCMAFSPDRRTLALGCGDGAVLLWDVSSGQKSHALRGHRGKVHALAFSPDGSRLASSSEDTTVLVWDLRRPQPPAAGVADRPKTEQLLAALAQVDAAEAYRALCQLVEAPGTAIADLRKQLQPPPLVDAKQVQGWLEDLDSKDFKARSRAFAELAKNADSAEAALRQALDGNPTLEKRQRLEKLLEQIHPSHNAARLFVLRGVEVLEWIGTPEARKVLEELAQLPQGYLVSREAQTALGRLSRLKSVAATP